MTTLFTLWLHLCGLSQREAAAFLEVSLRSVEDYHSGRRRCPLGIIADLRTLRARIEREASGRLAFWENAGRPTSVDLDVASDDHEAQMLGWPCVGAQRAGVALIAAALPPEVDTRIVPRG